VSKSQKVNVKCINWVSVAWGSVSVSKSFLTVMKTTIFVTASLVALAETDGEDEDFFAPCEGEVYRLGTLNYEEKGDDKGCK